MSDGLFEEAKKTTGYSPEDYTKEENVAEFMGEMPSISVGSGADLSKSVQEAQRESTATAFLNLYDDNAEQATIAIDKARKAQAKGLLASPQMFMDMDNSEMEVLSAKELSSDFQKIIIGNPSRVATYRDQLPQLDAWVRAARWANMSHEERMKEIQASYEKNGVPYPKRIEMTTQGYRLLPSGRFVKDGRVENAPVSYLETCGPEERKVIERGMRLIRKEAKFDPFNVEMGGLTDEGKKYLVGQAVAHFKKRIALLNELNMRMGASWREMGDADLTRKLNQISRERGVDLSDIELPTLRKGGMESVDYAEALNVLGWRDIAKYGRRLFGYTKSPEELAQIDGNSPIEDQLELLTYLSEQSEAIRGLTMTGNVANAIAMCIPYMIEFGLTGGMATVAKHGVRLGLKNAIKFSMKQQGIDGLGSFVKALGSSKGWKALGSASKDVLTGELRRTPLMLPKDAAQALNEWEGGPVYAMDGNGVKTYVPEAQVDELFTLIGRTVLRDYTERVSEWGGEVLPLDGALSKLVPKKWRNRIVQEFANRVSRDPAKGGMLLRSLRDGVPLSGWASEAMEEFWNNALERAETLGYQMTGIEVLNMNRESIVESGEEAATILISTAVMTNGHKVIRIPYQIQRYRDFAKLKDDHDAMVNAAAEVPMEHRSPEQAREFYERMNTREFGVDPEDARTFYQSDPDMAGRVGITEEAIAEAEDKGRLVPVSQSRLIAEQAKSPKDREAGDRLLGMVQSWGMSLKEALARDGGQELLDALREHRSDREKLKQKLMSVFTGAKAAGLSSSSIRPFVEVLSFAAEHLADNLTTGTEEVERAIDALLERTITPSKVEVGTARARTAARVAGVRRGGQKPEAEQKTEPEAKAEVEQKTEPEAEQKTEKARSESAADRRWREKEEKEEADRLKREEKERERLQNASDAKAYLLENGEYARYEKAVKVRVSKVLRAYPNYSFDESVLEDVLWAEIGRAIKAHDESKGASLATLASAYMKNGLSTYLAKERKRQDGFTSLDEEVSGKDGDTATRADFVADSQGTPLQELSSKELDQEIREWFAGLSPLEQKVVACMGRDEYKTATGEYNGAAIAREVGVSRETTNRILRRAEAYKARLKRTLPQAAQVSPGLRGLLRRIAEEKGLQDDPVLKVLLGDGNGAIRTKRGTIAVPFDGGGQHAIAKHLVETGKASTGGVTLEELAKYLPMAHEIGERKFEKSPKIGRRKRRQGEGNAVYTLTPEGQSYGYRLVTAVDGGKETLVTFHSTLGEKATKKAVQSTISRSKTDLSLENRYEDTIHQLFGNSSEIRGSFTPGEKFAESFQAVIELVKGKANVSTLCHESAHWLKALMEALCEMKDAEGNFLASEQLRGELDSINKWLDRQTYQEKEGTREREIEREEKFARAFEYYIQNGEPPTAGVSAAFRTLKRYLKAIYRWCRNFASQFGFEWDEEIERTFASMFATDATLDRESPLREALAELKGTFAGLTGITDKETADFVRLVNVADAQAEEALERRKRKLLPGLRRKWKESAEAAKDEIPVYKAWDGARKEPLDYRTLELDPTIGAENASALRKLGLASGKSKKGSDVPAFAERYGYSSPQSLVQDLLNAQSPEDFVKEQVNATEAKFQQDLGLDEEALSTKGTLDLLDGLIKLLREKSGRAERLQERAEMKRMAAEEIARMPVSQVERDTKQINALRTFNRKLVESIGKKEFTEALYQATQVRKGLIVLKEKSDAKREVDKTRRLLRRAVQAKRGRLYGTHHEALKELAFMFGFSGKRADAVENGKPNWRRQATAMADQDSGGGSLWPDAYFEDVPRRYQDISYGAFAELSDFARFLYGEGRELVKDAKGSFAQRANERVEACVAELSCQRAKYTDKQDKGLSARLGSFARGFFHCGENLATFLERADGYRANGPNTALRNLLKDAATREIELESGALSRCGRALKELAKEQKSIRIPRVRLDLTETSRLHGYSSWTPEMVIAACLNMGNELNRKRLTEGYGWTDEELAKIASSLSEGQWKQVQEIWDSLSGELQEAAGETFLEENHFHLKMVEAEEFEVQSSDGKTLTVRGGYYPLRYTHYSQKTQEQIGMSLRRLHRDVSSLHRRAESAKVSDPVKLSLTVPLVHIHETAQYAAMRMPLREVLSVVRDGRYETAFGTTQSFEYYKMLVALLKNMANPEAGTEGLGEGVERWARMTLTSTALMGNPSTVLMQATSATAGLEEVGGYYLDSLFEMSRGPMAFVESVKAKSAMMRHRAEYYDIDLRGSVNEFTDGKGKKVQRGFARAGYFAMRGLDALVASVAWDAKYRRVIADLLKEGKELPEAESKALAEADDFVARTQGAARTLDLTPVQLSRWGRMLSPFITSAGALYNTLYRTAGRTVHGELTVPEAAGALLSNLVIPALLAGMARWLIAGGAASGDDEESRLRASKAFMREVISSPFSGMPFVRDIVNKGTTMAIDRFYGGKRSYSGALFDAGALGALEEIGESVFSGAGALADGNPGRSLWLWSDALGNAFQVPVITIYRKAKRVYENNGGELPEILEEFDNAVKPARGRRRE